MTIQVGSKRVQITSAHPSSMRFYELLAELASLHSKKQADYGTGADPFANVRSSTEFGVPAWVGAMIRGNDKISRIKSLIRNGKLENEAVEDSFRDLAVYAIIALVLYEEERRPALVQTTAGELRARGENLPEDWRDDDLVVQALPG